MGKKVFKLMEIRDVQGRIFRAPDRDPNGNVIREPVLDTAGKQMTQVPRNANGDPVPNCQPEPVYRLKTKELSKTEALPEILKGLYLNIPPDKLTRQDTIYGTRMFQNFAAITDGVLEMDDDIHDWIKEKLKDEAIGLKVFGVDLYVVEQAVDNFERKHEPSQKK
jgi:hypothetical protein